MFKFFKAEFACGELANGKPGCSKSVPDVDQSAQAVFQFCSKSLGEVQIYPIGVATWLLNLHMENRPMASQGVPNLFQMLANQLKHCSNSVPNVGQSA